MARTGAFSRRHLPVKGAPPPDRFRSVCFSAGGALLILLGFLPLELLTEDIPQAVRIVALLGPLGWDWIGLLRLSSHVAALVLGLAGLGMQALLVLRQHRGIRPERLLAAIGLGAGMLGLILLGLGLAGLLHFRLLVGIQAFLGINVLVVLRRLLAPNAPPPPSRHRRSRSASALVPAALFILCAAWAALFLLPDLLAPEAFWDALVYHLAAPRRYLEMHKVVFMEPFFSQMPLLMSMNYALCLSMHGEALARGLNLALGASLVAVIWRLGKRWLGGAGAWLAAALAISSPMLGLLMIHAGSDMAVAFLSCLALLAFTRAHPAWPRGRSNLAGLALAGALAGLAGGSKLPGVAAAGLFVLLAFPLGLRASLVLTGGAAAFFLPWAVRSFLFTGNPAFPLLDWLFPSPVWSDFSREVYGGELAQVVNQVSLSFWPAGQSLIERFKNGLIGPVPALAVLAAILFRPRPRGAGVALLFVAGLGVLWAATVPAYRFYAAGLALLPLLLPLDRKFARLPVFLALLLQAVWFPLVIHQVDRPWAAARRQESREEFYAAIHANTSFGAFQRMEARYSPGPRRKALAVGEVRNFLAPSWTLGASYFEPSPFIRMAAESRDEHRLLLRLKQRGVRHLLVNVPETLRLTRWEGLCWKGAMPEMILVRFFARHSRLVFARQAAWVYEIGEKREGAAMPECFRGPRGERPALSCATRASRALVEGDAEKALRFGWAAVSADPLSSLSWATLGDALFLAARYDSAIGAYEEALQLGWRTSVVYHNYGIALAEEDQMRMARMALEYAVRLDPQVRRLRRDLNIITAEYMRPISKYLDNP